MKRPFVLWLICDGKPGHENQSLGLAEAMTRLTPCELHQISIGEKRGWLPRLRATVQDSRPLPPPDVIIAAGHSTHPSLLWLARKHRAMSVVLMRPSLPLSWFGLCIAPSHDFPAAPQMNNLILTRGALNRVTHSGGIKSGKLILIGGPSKTHGWDGLGLIEKLATATDRGGWELSDSRRTPSGFIADVARDLPGVTPFPHQETPPAWIPERLRAAKEVWVTEDSVSMIYESLTSGARVGLLPMPRLTQHSRVIAGLNELVADGFLTPFAEWLVTQRLSAPPETLREAERCAEILLHRLSSMR